MSSHGCFHKWRETRMDWPTDFCGVSSEVLAVCMFVVAKANVLVSLCSSPHLWLWGVVQRQRSQTQASEFPVKGGQAHSWKQNAELGYPRHIQSRGCCSSMLRSQLRLRFGHQDASRMFRERGFLAWKEYLEARPRQAVSHVGQEHLSFLLEELEGPSLLVWVYCVVRYIHAHTVCSLSPSPRLLLLNCHFSVNRDSSDMH